MSSKHCVSLLSYHLIRLKAEQQRIASLTSSSNRAIRDSDKTKVTLKRSLNEYQLLLQGASAVIGGLETPTGNLDTQAANEIDSLRHSCGLKA